jgi:hypothetical protein
MLRVGCWLLLISALAAAPGLPSCEITVDILDVFGDGITGGSVSAGGVSVPLDAPFGERRVIFTASRPPYSVSFSPDAYPEESYVTVAVLGKVVPGCVDVVFGPLDANVGQCKGCKNSC